MGVISKFEGGLDNALDRAAGMVFRGPIEPAQIAKRAEKQMHHEKLVGAGKQYAPTLYTVLVNSSDDRKLFAFYPTMAAEIETYLVAKGGQDGLKFDGRPLVRFIVDKGLKSGKFDIIAENVSAPTIAKLREEELEYYGLKEKKPAAPVAADAASPGQDAALIADLIDYDNDVLSAGQPSPTSTGGVLGQARLSNLSAGLSFALDSSPTTLGRDNSCDIVIRDANISRTHAQFTQDAMGTWKVTDLGSTNGIKVNGIRIMAALLRDGDQLTIGVSVLEFRER